MVPNITSSIANSLQIQNIRVIDLGYMGCATALLALELIEKELNAGEVGIVISAEITSVMMNLEAESNPSLVANSVFGDGIGAFLVAKKPHTYKAILSIKGHSASLITHDKALSCVTYDSNSIYHEINIHDTIPEVANEGIKAALPPIIKNHLATPYDKIKFVINKKIPEWQKNVDYAVLHTAGNKILHKLSENLKLKDKKVAHNFSAFNNYGNTSSASIYYALDYLYQENNVKPKQKFLFLAYGSGFFTRSCVMESI
jgi:3-ketoacyl-CoA synthase